MKKRFLTFFAIFALACITALSLAACSTGGFADDDAPVTVRDTSIISDALVLSEDGRTLSGVVAYDTEVFSFARDITLPARARMSVYSDEACTIKVPKKVNLSFGENVCYLRVTNGASCAVYRAVVTRGRMATLSFDLSEGAAAVPMIPAQNETVGMKPSSLPQPTWAGHLFNGWYTDPECTNAFTDGDLLSGDTTLYAGWKPGPGGVVSLTWLCDGDVYATATIAYGDAAAFPAPPASDADRLFDGWLDADGNKADETLPMTDNAVFTACFITEKHTVTYLYEGETLRTEAVFLGRKATAPAAPSVPDPVAFLGWYEEGAAQPFDFSAGIDRDLRLTARFTAPDYTRTASVAATLPVTEEAARLFEDLLSGNGTPGLTHSHILRRTVKGWGDFALSAALSVRVERAGGYTLSVEATAADGSYQAKVVDAVTSDVAVVITGSLHLGVALTDEGREALTYAEMLGQLLKDIDYSDPEVVETQLRFIISLILSQISGGAGEGEAF